MRTKAMLLAGAFLAAPVHAGILGSVEAQLSSDSMVVYEGGNVSLFGQMTYSPDPGFVDGSYEGDNRISQQSQSSLSGLNWGILDLTSNATLGSGFSTSTTTNAFANRAFADEGSFSFRLSGSYSDQAEQSSQARYWQSSGQYIPHQVLVSSGYWQTYSYSCGFLGWSTCYENRWIDTSYYETQWTWQDTSHWEYTAASYTALSGSGTFSTQLNVTVLNVAPSIFGVYTSGFADLYQPFTFGAMATDPGINDALTYAWDMNDDGIYGDVYGSGGMWGYATPGVHNIGLRVSDGDGGVAFANTSVAVVGPPPPPPPPVENGVPEPGTLALFGLSLAGLWRNARKRVS